MKMRSCPITPILPAGLLAMTFAAVLLLSGCSSMTRDRPKLYQMGDRAEAGLLIYTVLEAEWPTQLGEGIQARIPKHRFLVLRLSVTNSGTEEVLVPAMQMIGPNNDSHPELMSGEGVPDWLGVVRRVEPAETMHGRVLFDLPRGDYRLRVTDEDLDPAQAKVALIEVPLRFESRHSTFNVP